MGSKDHPSPQGDKKMANLNAYLGELTYFVGLDLLSLRSRRVNPKSLYRVLIHKGLHLSVVCE
jgi:hypothetical protein